MTSCLVEKICVTKNLIKSVLIRSIRVIRVPFSES